MASPQEQAREILSERRFQEPEVPRPFERPLGWAGDRVEDAGGWLGDRFDGINGALPGGAWVVWVLVGLSVAGLAVLLARAVIAKRVRSVPESGTNLTHYVDPAELEREADAAERSGDWERAVRLRFRAGAIRLERENETTGAIAAALRDDTFDRLGHDFDLIAYGGQPATEADADDSRRGWKALLQ